MRSKTSFWKRSLAAFLSFVMLLGMVPALGIVPEAEAAVTDVTDSYITMPITIRDFAADGMLFEFNQVGANGTASIGGAAPTVSFDGGGNLSNANFTKAAQSGYTRFTATGTGYGQAITYYVNNAGTNATMRYVVMKYRTSSAATATPIIRIRSNPEVQANLPTDGYGQSSFKTVVFDTGGTATNNVGYVTLHTYLASGAYIDIAYIAFFDNLADANTYKSNDGQVIASATYNQGDTAGFSMLATTANDYINNLTDSASIAGTTLLQNGSWGLTTDPAAVTMTLNSGAKQSVYGAWIRTDLVQPTLVNGKMVYTEAAVKYIAEYMQQIMAVPEKNSDGSYNTYFVKGHKLSDLGGTDLATKIRAEVTGGLGTYASAKAKYEAGNLSVYTGIETWYDAAYFLLHNTFTDSTGYGKTASNYKNLHLVQTTNANGEVCYVFNSGYDGAVYDYANGMIYNTQTSTVTAAKNSNGSDAYVRGNKLPAARFDPLGPSGAGAAYGYGMSGDIYGDMITDSTADWAEYYDNTNYNLSLEGHAQFIYYEDSNLYFTFTGDDDVYLFINGIRVLDVGAAHSISKVQIKLNDVAEMCGLQDGEAYDFDFFYMERHGTAANFGIETNIKIVDPAMTTTKEGFQNGISTGYNGYVDPLTPVYYSFGLQNNGEAPIEDLTFRDDDIGVYLSKDTITLNQETLDNRQYVGAIVYNADGSTKSHTDNISDDALKALLDGELAVGEQIIVYGFRYTIPTDKWTAGNGTFPNTVYTTAVGVGDNAGQNLNGMADWKVQKRYYEIKDYHIYEWMGKGVTLNKDELLQPVVDAVPGFDKSAATIAVSSASGSTTGVNVNTKAKLQSDGSIIYTGTKTGADTFYYKVTEGTVTVVIGVAVYSYDVADNTYVLDYGLAVELNGDDFGFRKNDTLILADNPNATTATVTGVQDATSNYGTFTWAAPSLKYTPTDIIDNTDSIRANVQILENGADSVTKFTGVNMYETVTTAPANVVYYEENHPGITYVSSDENQWVQYETVDPETGESVAGTEQSADQDSNYGSDPNYEADKEGVWDTDVEVTGSTSFVLDTTDLDALQAAGIDALNSYLGLSGADSNGTVKELVVNETAEVMYFDFVGTGFEIISRTTTEKYAVINVQVQQDADGDGVFETVFTQKPVITESIGGDLYQVPIISITGLPKAEYRVVVKAAGSTDTKTRVLYIDGIRIYGPLDSGEALEYYNPEEYQAEFFEVKKLIQNGQMIYADASDSDGDFAMVTGTTMIENVEGGAVLTYAESVEDYMSFGPNNEIYLDAQSGYGVVAFFLTPIENYPESARTVQIGAHRKTDSYLEDDGSVTMHYGSTAEDIINGNAELSNAYTVQSGTEMYYTINVNNLVLDANGKYLVMIGINSANGDMESSVLALTNLKVAGYDVTFAEAALTEADANGTLNDVSLLKTVASVYTARMAAMESEPEEEEIPINENLNINTAKLRVASVVSGKNVTVTVTAGAAAQIIVVTDADGNVVEAVRTVRKVSGDVATFTFMWKVTGSRGDALTYTIRVYDADGLASVNTETVTVTIK